MLNSSGIYEVTLQYGNHLILLMHHYAFENKYKATSEKRQIRITLIIEVPSIRLGYQPVVHLHCEVTLPYGTCTFLFQKTSYFQITMQRYTPYCATYLRN